MVKSKTSPWIVAAVIVLLLIIALPVLGGISQAFFEARAHNSTGAKIARTESNMKQVILAIMMYGVDNDDRYPPLHSKALLVEAMAPYTSGSSKDLFVTENPMGGEVVGNQELAFVKSWRVPNYEETVLIYETKEWPSGGRCYGFADGDVKFVRDISSLVWSVEPSD